MENKINISELLRDCPQGMELDCTLWDNVTFDRVADGGIWIKHIDSKSGERSLYVYNDGSFPIHNLGSFRTKCVIFPKGKTTWEGFVPPCKFKDGDVIVASGAIAIFKQVHSLYEEPQVDFYCGVTSKHRSFILKTGDGLHCGKISSARLATEEEKAELCRAIKDNGYRWDDETKTLVKLPKFKVGYKIKCIKTGSIYEIIKIVPNYYIANYLGSDIMISWNDHDKYEIVSNKFDISKLKPFDKVLVRDSDTQEWGISFFSHCNGLETYKYSCINSSAYAQCIPYEGNEHLFDTVNECNNFFKIWEE